MTVVEHGMHPSPRTEEDFTQSHGVLVHYPDTDDDERGKDRPVVEPVDPRCSGPADQPAVRTRTSSALDLRSEAE